MLYQNFVVHLQCSKEMGMSTTKINIDNSGKIKSKRCSYDGIDFRSKAERDCYIALRKAKYKPDYERETITMIESFTPNGVIYNKSSKSSKSRGLKQINKVRAMKYTPDFTLMKNDTKVYIEVKGFPNDAYPLRIKCFYDWLNKQDFKWLFLEVGEKDFDEMIAIIDAVE